MADEQDLPEKDSDICLSVPCEKKLYAPKLSKRTSGREQTMFN